MVWTDDIRLAHDFILAGGGSSVTALIIGDKMFRRESDIAKMADEFLRLCPNVTSLSVRDASGIWARRFGPRVETLEIISADIGLHAIPKYCSRLREITVSSPMIFDRPLPIDSLCDGCAGTLECLNIAGFHLNVEQIRKKQATCRGIRRISVMGNADAVSQLLISYGNRLEFASFGGFTENQINAVAVACRNARFQVCMRPSDALLPALNVLGDRLENIHVHLRGHGGNGGNINQVTAAWNRCVDLQQLELLGCTLCQIRAIMATPKVNLKVVSITITADTDKEKVWDECASGCKNIEKISIFDPPIRLRA